jgi:hypothetical protein
MSMPVLIEVYDEVRRLAIAGSAVAPGDFRLKKLVPPLTKSGEKAPVFAKVAQAVSAVVDSNDKTASAALLELTTLVNAILYTQGETGMPGELKPLETTDLGQQVTQAGARVLKPLLEALSSTGSGRLELVRDAFSRGAFKDLRLVKPALSAIDDPYPEIGEFIAENVLPLYGKAIMPQLRATLDIKGKAGHVKRLQLMHWLDADASRDVVQSALAEGSKEMRVAAIECLGTTGEDLLHLMEHARSKAKDVRAAALRALSSAGVSSSDVITTLKKAIDGGDLELLIARLRDCPLPEIQQYVLDQAEQQFAGLLKLKDKTQQGAAVNRLRQLVSSLEDRTDAGAEAFLLRCFESADKLTAIKSEPSGADLNELVANVLSHGSPKMQKQLVDARETLSGPTLYSALLAARTIKSPADFFTEFSPVLKPVGEKRTKKNGTEVDRAEALLRVLLSQSDRYDPRRWRILRDVARREPAPLPELDPRWLDAAVAAESLELVNRLARPGHAATEKFLSDQLTKMKKSHESQRVVQVMVRIGHPGAVDAIIDALQAQAKETHYYYVGYWYGRMIPDLPKSALPKIEAILPTLPEKMIDQLMESVQALKNKPE